MNEVDVHALGIGKIIGNLQSLELVIRNFLERIESGNMSARRPNLFSVKPGDRLPVTALTNYDTLGKAIDKYNAHIAAINPELAVGRSVVDLRDALAHGRLLAAAPRRPIRLFKFSAPREGTVKVQMAVDVTDEWLAAQRRLVNDAGKKVKKALEMLENTQGKGGAHGTTG